MRFLTRFCCHTQTTKPAPPSSFFLSEVPTDRSSSVGWSGVPSDRFWSLGRKQNPPCRMMGTNSLLENRS